MSEGIQIAVLVVLTLTLIAVLWYTRETRLLRQDQLRPVLDIRKVKQFGMSPEAMAEALAERTSDNHVWCVLKNIGVGPVLNISALVMTQTGEKQEDLGVLGVDTEAARQPFAVTQRSVEVRYRDVYGRLFYSRRPASFDEEGAHLGDLETGQIG